MELVEPEAVLVKEEKVEANTSRVEETEEDVQLIGDDGEYTIKNLNFLSAAPLSVWEAVNYWKWTFIQIPVYFFIPHLEKDFTDMVSL